MPPASPPPGSPAPVPGGRHRTDLGRVPHSIQRAWATFSSNDSGLPGNAGGMGDASIGSDPRSDAAPIPVGDLLGEDVDITPARHLPSIPVARVSLDILNRHRSSLAPCSRNCRTYARPPSGPPFTGSAPRDASLEELAQSGMLFIRRTAPRAVIEESSLPKVRRIIITGRDLVRAVPPGRNYVPDDEVLSPRVREGDVLVPHVARQLIARVAQGQDVGTALSSSVVLIRPDPAVFDPWYMAGLLSSSDSGRRPPEWPAPSATPSALTLAASASRSSRSRTSGSTARPSAALPT